MVVLKVVVITANVAAGGETDAGDRGNRQVVLCGDRAYVCVCVCVCVCSGGHRLQYRYLYNTPVLYLHPRECYTFCIIQSHTIMI